MAPATIPRWLILIAAFAAIYLIWGSTYVAIRLCELGGMPPFLMAGTRYMTAGIVMMLVAAAAKQNIKMTASQWRSSAILGALLLLFGNGGVVIAEMTVPSGLVSLIVAIVPILVTLLCWFGPDKERPTPSLWLGLSLGLAGIITLIGPGAIVGSGDVNPIGALCVIAASVAWAVGSVFTKHLDVPKATTVACASQMVCGGIMMLIVSLCLGEPGHFQPTNVSWQAATALGYLIVFGSIVAYSAYSWLINNVNAKQVSTYAYVNPIVAVFLGWALVGEPVSQKTLVAAAMIIGAVALVNLGKRAKVASSAKLFRPEPLFASNRAE